jgi:hypothetical protein
VDHALVCPMCVHCFEPPCSIPVTASTSSVPIDETTHRDAKRWQSSPNQRSLPAEIPRAPELTETKPGNWSNEGLERVRDTQGSSRWFARSLGDRHAWLIISGNLAIAALLSSYTDAAPGAFREELRLCREMVVRPIVFEGLRGLAAVAAVHGDDRRAATLVGAADAHRYDEPEDAVDARLNTACFEPARKRHGADAWDAITRHGGALNFEDAIAYALEEARN